MSRLSKIAPIPAGSWTKVYSGRAHLKGAS
jgi:hypothetical protein